MAGYKQDSVSVEGINNRFFPIVDVLFKGRPRLQSDFHL